MKDDKPSMTAVLIAYCVLLVGGDAYGQSRMPDGIIYAQVAVLVQANVCFSRCPWILCNPIVAKLCRFFAAIFYPDFFACIGFRKMMIECQVREFLRHTATTATMTEAEEATRVYTNNKPQVVVVAAGYDTLAIRLCREYAHVDFWEVDHPATSRVKSRVWATSSKDYPTKKRHRLSVLGEQPPNMEHVQADLTKTHLDTVLKKQPKYDPSRPTIVVMEGLSMYLTEEQMRGLFDDIEKSVSPESRVVFDFFGWNEPRQTVDVGWVFPSLHRHGFTGGAEPWIWGLDPKNIHSFFDDTNWNVQEDVQSCGYENVAVLVLN